MQLPPARHTIVAAILPLRLALAFTLAALLSPNSAHGDEPPRVLVLAAASTSTVVDELAEAYQGRHDVRVAVSSGPSNALARQAIEGVPAHLFLSASPEWAEEVVRQLPGSRTVELARGELVLAVPRGNPAALNRPADLRPQHRLALAGEQVPAGKYAEQALGSLELLEELSARKQIVRAKDVRAALAYVARGEVDAGIVYRTDVLLDDDVEAVYAFDANTHDPIIYTLVLLPEGEKHPASRAFFEYLTSDEAAKMFAARGFRPAK